MLEVEHLKAGYGPGHEIVHDVSFTLDEGAFCCIIGANGCGKTTALKTILGLLKPMGGTVKISGKDVYSMTDRERASYFAYIPQTNKLPFPYTVKNMVMMGRTPYMKRMAQATRADKRIAYAAMCQLEIEHLANEPFTDLSGGQQQLVLIARALAQQPDYLIMDEPTASLDFGNQQLVLSRMRNLVDCGMSVLMVTHDPAHAFYCADRVIVFYKGKVLHDGAPDEVITPETMKTIYGTEVRIDRMDIGDGKIGFACIPISREYNTDPRFLQVLLNKPE